MPGTFRLAAALLIAAAPAAAQTTGCARGPDGHLVCGVQPAARGPGTAHRHLGADALARSKAQAEALKASADRQRAETDRQEAQRRQSECLARAAEGADPAGVPACAP